MKNLTSIELSDHYNEEARRLFTFWKKRHRILRMASLNDQFFRAVEKTLMLEELFKDLSHELRRNNQPTDNHESNKLD